MKAPCRQIALARRPQNLQSNRRGLDIPQTLNPKAGKFWLCWVLQGLAEPYRHLSVAMPQNSSPCGLPFLGDVSHLMLWA